jgi:hypothetical protein
MGESDNRTRDGGHSYRDKILRLFRRSRWDPRLIDNHLELPSKTSEKLLIRELGKESFEAIRSQNAQINNSVGGSLE